MPQDRDMIESQALDWVIRMQAPAFDAWEAFEIWLSEDPAHAEAYHVIATADQDMVALLVAASPPPAIAPANPAQPTSRRLWLGGALAASFAAMIGYGVISTQSSPYQVATGPGMRKTVTLADGSNIVLNGATRLTLDSKNPRHAVLEQGEAVFTVVHDDTRPFRVAVGNATLLDVGTRFNVVRSGGITQIQVAEGAVVYNPDAEAVRLNAGKSLHASDGSVTLALADIAPADVATWKEGRFVYGGQPMEQVAADLSRYIGQPVETEPDVAARPFHGVLSLGNGQDIRSLGPLLNVAVARSGSGWKLSSRKP